MANEDHNVLPKGCLTLADAVLAYEAVLITDALKASKGKLVPAAAMLGISYQLLGYLLKTRHRGLTLLRSKVLRRRPRIRRIDEQRTEKLAKHERLKLLLEQVS